MKRLLWLLAFAAGCASTPPPPEPRDHTDERSPAIRSEARGPADAGPPDAEPRTEAAPSPATAERIRYPSKSEAQPDSSVSTGKPDAAHQGLQPLEILSVVKAEQGRIKACYERRLPDAPGLAGKIDIRWKIDATGAVVQAGLKSTTMNDSQVENCIVDVVRTMQFPESRNEKASIVTFPFIFGQG